MNGFNIKKPQKEVVIKQEPFVVNMNGKMVKIIDIKKNGDMVVSSF